MCSGERRLEELRERVSGRLEVPVEEREVCVSLSRLSLISAEEESLEEAVEEVVSSLVFLVRGGRLRVDDVGRMAVLELRALGWL